jgi:hypothetical protein
MIPFICVPLKIEKGVEVGSEGERIAYMGLETFLNLIYY